MRAEVSGHLGGRAERRVDRTQTRFVSTGPDSIAKPSVSSNASASIRAWAWSSASRST